MVTRIDAPALVVQGGETVDQIAPGRLVRDAVMLDLTHKEPNDPIDDEDLEGAEESAGLAVRENEIVILHVGRKQFAPNYDSFSTYPYLSENGSEYLELRHVAAVGIDAPNVENPVNRGLPVHKALLSSGTLVLENLSNLETLEEERFRLVAVSPKVKAASAPIRCWPWSMSEPRTNVLREFHPD